MDPQVVHHQEAGLPCRDLLEKLPQRVQELNAVYRLLGGVRRDHPTVDILKAADGYCLEPQLITYASRHALAWQHPGVHICLLRRKHTFVGEVDPCTGLDQRHHLSKAALAAFKLVLGLRSREKDLLAHPAVLDAMVPINLSNSGG